MPAEDVPSKIERNHRQIRSNKKDRTNKSYHSKSSRTGLQAASGRHPFKNKGIIRSYSDTSTTSSSDEGYGYYEMNRSGGNRHGRKYATLAAASVSRRRTKSRNGRISEAQRNLWRKGDNSSNDSFEKTKENSNSTFRDINKLSTAAFTEALKKHFSGLGSRHTTEFNPAQQPNLTDTRVDGTEGSFYIDSAFDVSSRLVRQDPASLGNYKKPRKVKRKQKYYHKSSESILQRTPQDFEDLPPALPPRDPTNNTGFSQRPPPVPPYTTKPTGSAKIKPYHDSGRTSEYSYGHLSEGEALSLNRKSARGEYQSSNNTPRNIDEVRAVRHLHQHEEGYFKFSAKHIDEVFASLQKHNRDSSTSHTSPSSVKASERSESKSGKNSRHTSPKVLHTGNVGTSSKKSGSKAAKSFESNLAHPEQLRGLEKTSSKSPLLKYPQEPKYGVTSKAMLQDELMSKISSKRPGVEVLDFTSNRKKMLELERQELKRIQNLNNPGQVHLPQRMEGMSNTSSAYIGEIDSSYNEMGIEYAKPTTSLRLGKSNEADAETDEDEDIDLSGRSMRSNNQTKKVYKHKFPNNKRLAKDMASKQKQKSDSTESEHTNPGVVHNVKMYHTTALEKNRSHLFNPSKPQEPLINPNVNPNAWTPDSSQLEEEEDSALRLRDTKLSSKCTTTSKGNELLLPTDPTLAGTFQHASMSKKSADGLSSSSHSQSNELSFERKKGHTKSGLEQYSGHKRSSSHGHVDTRLAVFRNDQAKPPISIKQKDSVMAEDASSMKIKEKSLIASEFSERSRGIINLKQEHGEAQLKEGDLEGFSFQTIDPPKLFDTPLDTDTTSHVPDREAIGKTKTTGTTRHSSNSSFQKYSKPIGPLVTSSVKPSSQNPGILSKRHTSR